MTKTPVAAKGTRGDRRYVRYDELPEQDERQGAMERGP